MNKEQLRLEVNPQIKVLEDVQRDIAAVLVAVKPTVNNDNASGHNTCAMEAVLRLSQNPACPANLKPVLNKMHKALYKNASFNLQETIREKSDELKALMPGQMKPKKRAKEDSVEISEPAVLLSLVK